MNEIPELIATVGSRDVSTSTSCCPDGWTPYRGRCYYFARSERTWGGARSWCRLRSGDLALANTRSRNTFIRNLTYGVARVWIGLNDISNEGHFHWVRTNQNVGYENWGSGEPNSYLHYNEDCVETNYHGNGLWNDARCSHTFRFVCGRSANNA